MHSTISVAKNGKIKEQDLTSGVEGIKYMLKAALLCGLLFICDNRLIFFLHKGFFFF